jgi:hypothetical protein
MLPHRTCLHPTSSILTVHISCHIIAVSVFIKSLFINSTLPYLRVLHKYSVQYYPQFHVTVVGFWTYYSWIREHTCTSIFCLVIYNTSKYHPYTLKNPILVTLVVGAYEHWTEENIIWRKCSIYLTLCRSHLKPYCMGRKTVFFSAGV